MNLVRIFPRTKIGGNIFSDPDEKSDQNKRKVEIHGTPLGCDGKIDFRFPEKYERGDYQKYPNVVDVVMVATGRDGNQDIVAGTGG